jgi:uncharacterized membrane protein
MSVLRLSLLRNILSFAVFAALFLIPFLSHAQSELVPEQITISKAQAVSVETKQNTTVAGTDLQTTSQTIRAKVLEGEEKGREITFDNDYIPLEKGEIFYLRHAIGAYDGTDVYAVYDRYRIPQLFTIALIFLVAVIIFGGWQGIRGLVSLLGSFLLILFVLLPGVLHGYPPLLVTVGVSSLVIIVGSYVTHGFTRSTTAAVIGMVATVSITGMLAYWSVYFTKLSGLGSEEAVYLNLNSGGSIDVIGLLLGGIIIGLLGVLYDAAIGQAVAVEELIKVAPHVAKHTIYERALRIGREHIGALVNTLAIAYVGAALPLLLLFKQASSASILETANTELFATEIVRILIGSIGLVLAVPITTFVAVWFLKQKKNEHVSEDRVHSEEDALDRISDHSHTH